MQQVEDEEERRDGGAARRRRGTAQAQALDTMLAKSGKKLDQVVEMEVDEVGPSLKYATVKIAKTSPGGGGGGGSFGGGSTAQGSTADPWAAAAPAATTEPPF